MNINKITNKYLSVIAIILITLGVGFWYFIISDNANGAEKSDKAVVENIKAESKYSEYELCSKWIGNEISVPVGTECMYDGTQNIQTYSDIQIWSFNEQKWVEPDGVGDPKEKTVLTARDPELAQYYPILINCPWGCTLGYTAE